MWRLPQVQVAEGGLQDPQQQLKEVLKLVSGFKGTKSIVRTCEKVGLLANILLL